MQNRISARQAYSLLFISRIISLLTFVPSLISDALPSDYLAACVLGAIIALALSFPWLYLSVKRQRGEDLLERFKNTKKEKPIRFIFALYLLFLLCITLSRLFFFARAVMFEQVSTLVLIFITLLCLGFVSLSGAEPLARLGGASAILSAVLIVFISVSLTGSFNAENLMYKNTSALPFLLLSLSVAVRTTEPLFLFLLTPEINGKLLKGFFSWWIFTFLASLLLTFCLGLSLGMSAYKMMFPYHAMAELSSFGVAERMDSLLSALWVLASFIKAAMLNYLLMKTVKEIYPSLSRKKTAVLTLAPVFAVCILTQSSAEIYRAFNLFWIRAVLYVLMIILFPLVVIVTDKKHLKRKQ